MLTDGRFWVGFLLGVGAFYAYGKYSAKSA
jgi:hypothetical protein